MNDMQSFRGFEDVWRPPSSRMVRPREGSPPPAGGGRIRAKLQRLVSRSPEVVLKVASRIYSEKGLKAHLDYISREGDLELETPGGLSTAGRAEVRELAEAWSRIAEDDSHRRVDTSLGISLVLSMPAGTDPLALRDAANSFASTALTQHEYVLALHTDTASPHVHLTVCTRALMGERLNPQKPLVAEWREAFASALRDRGVAAEATPRRARGVVDRSQSAALYRLQARFRAGEAQAPQALLSAYKDAAKAAFADDDSSRPWEQAISKRQTRIRALYLAQARLLQASESQDDRWLGNQVEAFVRDMRAPETRRQVLVRSMRSQIARERAENTQQPPRRTEERER